MAIINTSSPAYLNYLDQLRTIHTLARQNYGPIVSRLNREQLIQLYQRDPLFAELVDITRELAQVAERAGIEL